MTATPSPIVIASVWSCVTYRVVVPSSWCSRAMYARISTRSLASRFDSGSPPRKGAGARRTARRNPLALTAGELARAAREVVLDAEAAGDRQHPLGTRRAVLHLQREPEV